MSTTSGQVPSGSSSHDDTSDPPDDNKTVIGGANLTFPPRPAAAAAKAAPAVVDETPSVIIDLEAEHDGKTMMGYTLEELSRPPAPLQAVAPPTPPPADDDADVKTMMGYTLEELSRPPAPAKVAAPPTPPPADDDADVKTMMGYTLEELSRPPAPAKAAPAAPAAPEPEEDNRTIIVSGTTNTTPPSSKKPVEDDAPMATIMVSEGLSAVPSSPGKKPTTSPPVSENTRRDASPFDPPTSQDRPPTGPTATRSPSSWPGVTDSGITGGTGLGGAAHVGMPEAGMYINQYEVIRLLGEGGMGSVFLARDTRLGRRVAIKFLQSTDPEMTKRFVIEARATARVEHENIVSIYEVGEWGGHPFMVLQFLQGSGLEKVIPRGKQMPVQRVVEIMTPVLRALAYAHGEGIVHRDLKPDNIFITDGGVTKVLDFGIAKVVQGDDRTSDGEGKVSKEDVAAMGADKGMTRHGAVMGTMPYMSPEQWGNGVAIDHTTDIWAVGIMMFIMLSGRHPLYPMTGTELMVTGFLDEPMPSLREKAPELPKEVCDIVDRCLQKEKAKRFPDALSLLRALEPLARMGGASETVITVSDRPYAGLASFQEEDASRFFGRSRETAAMTQRLRERPLMAVVGPSGVGKSSFLRAGVVPALKHSGENWDISVIRPGRSPLMALAGLLLQSSQTSTNIDDEIEIQQKLAQRLTNEPGYLGTALRRQAKREKKNILLFVDQFEELYTLVGKAEERLAFTACLSAAADDPTSPMRVVVSIRSDFLDRCVEDVHFMNELSQGLFFITAPTREGMRDALVLPAQMAGYKFENEGIVNEMLDHLAHTSGALPLLQFTADKLWAERDPTKKILTESSYRALGGIAGALASHADRVIEQISGEQRTLVRALFLRLVTPERTRAIVSMDELREALGKNAGDVQGLIDQMVAARLLVVQTSGGGGATVELVHESLIHGWPQLARWLDEGQEDSVFLEQLRNGARQWAAKNKDKDLLWRGEMAEEAKRFTRRYRGQLAEVQSQFLKAVIDQSLRAARLKKVLYVASSAFLLMLLAAAAVALYIINDSRAETQQQAIAAQAAEKKAKEAAVIAEQRKEEAEDAKEEAVKALEEAKAAEAAKEKAREAEKKALEAETRSKAELAQALVEAQEAEKRAVAAAEEAKRQSALAEQRAIEANEARNAATKAAGELKVALAEVEVRRKQAEAAKNAAEKKLAEMTRGGVVEVLR